ncbi:YybH family protein [Paludisphaera soli]|uniref:YybH family protein n=1 Tax=Paludisphaera soli TaxID=2712865 RepID=UPI0013EBEB3E|nr:SgcJ/EcaC family oxidoreductase [Paludisphaera soli]
MAWLSAVRGLVLATTPLIGVLTAGPEAAAQPASGPPIGEAEIRAFDDSYVRLFDGGDAKGLASLFTEDAEVFEADGARYRGRDLIERSFAESMAAQKGARLSLEIESIRLLTPDVAKEEGRSVTTLASGAVDTRYYTALLVKREGGWLLASVREEADERVRPHDRLKELEWMLGEWVDSGTESETRVDCRWSPDGNFLIREFTARRLGKPVLNVTQRVGWDPVAGEFRSWEFDSEGGFGEGRWSRDGDRWVVKQTGTRPEGVNASSTRVLERIRSDQVRWSLLDRVIAGAAIPGEETSLLTRIPPAPNTPKTRK